MKKQALAAFTHATHSWDALERWALYICTHLCALTLTHCSIRSGCSILQLPVKWLRLGHDQPRVALGPSQQFKSLFWCGEQRRRTTLRRGTESLWCKKPGQTDAESLEPCLSHLASLSPSGPQPSPGWLWSPAGGGSLQMAACWAHRRAADKSVQFLRPPCFSEKAENRRSHNKATQNNEGDDQMGPYHAKFTSPIVCTAIGICLRSGSKLPRYEKQNSKLQSSKVIIWLSMLLSGAL